MTSDNPKYQNRKELNDDYSRILREDIKELERLGLPKYSFNITKLGALRELYCKLPDDFYTNNEKRLSSADMEDKINYWLSEGNPVVEALEGIYELRAGNWVKVTAFELNSAYPISEKAFKECVNEETRKELELLIKNS